MSLDVGPLAPCEFQPARTPASGPAKVLRIVGDDRQGVAAENLRGIAVGVDDEPGALRRQRGDGARDQRRAAERQRRLVGAAEFCARGRRRG